MIDNPVMLPALRLAHGGAKHLLAERHDEAGVLGDRDELDRRQEATNRMVPTNERLGGDESATTRIDYGLVEDLELIRFEAVADADLGLQTSQGVFVHLGLVHLVAAFTFSLGDVHGEVG